MKVTITLPPPDPRLHAHAKGHWRTKTKPTKELRELACAITKQQSNGQSWQRARIEYRFYFKDNRRRDEANAIYSMKPALDGIVDAGLLVDDNWKCLTTTAVVCQVDRDNPRTELLLEEWPE